jgi:hypothetical protein
LTEEGDPRGEFIQVQLALEDPARTKQQRAALRARETELLKKHVRTWLGDLGRFLVGTWSGESKPYHYRFARGWLDFVRVLPFPEGIVAALARAPEARLLQRLEVVYDMRYHHFGFDQFTQRPARQLRDGEGPGQGTYPYAALPYLADSPVLRNLRALKFGFSDDHPGGPSHSTMVGPCCGSATVKQLLGVLTKNPRLEELYLNTALPNIDTLFRSPLLGTLRVFQYYYGTGTYGQTTPATYPLGVLARNKALANLTTLRLHPGRDAQIDPDQLSALLRSRNLPALRHLQVHMTTFHDDGASLIVHSGILKRLKSLDIGYGNMTDAGAVVLAACPDLKNLELLDVSRNSLSPAGIRALRATGVRLVAEEQHHEEQDEYLVGVDWE